MVLEPGRIKHTVQYIRQGFFFIKRNLCRPDQVSQSHSGSFQAKGDGSCRLLFFLISCDFLIYSHTHCILIAISVLCRNTDRIHIIKICFVFDHPIIRWNTGKMLSIAKHSQLGRSQCPFLIVLCINRKYPRFPVDHFSILQVWTDRRPQILHLWSWRRRILWNLSLFLIIIIISGFCVIFLYHLGVIKDFCNWLFFSIFIVLWSGRLLPISMLAGLCTRIFRLFLWISLI